MVEHEITFYIGGAQEKITQRLFSANDMAYVFGIDTSVIVHFNKNSVIEKVVKGLPELEGKWDLCMVIRAFGPGKYCVKKHATEAAKKTSIKDYPSRIELQVGYCTFVYMDTYDIFQLFLNLNFPGLRKDAVPVQQISCTTMSIQDPKNYTLETGEEIVIRAKKRPCMIANADKIRDRKRACMIANADKIRDRKRAYYYKNKDKLRAKKRAYRIANADKIRDRNRSYYLIHLDKIKTHNKAYAAVNVDKIRAYGRLYFKKNMDKLRAKHKAYRKEKLDKIRANSSVYRSAKRDDLLSKKRAYYAKNRDEIRDRRKAYHVLNRDGINTRMKKYRLRKYGCINCKDWPDPRKGWSHYDSMCFRCFSEKFPHDERVKTRGRVELRVRSYLDSHFPDFVHDLPIFTGNCACPHRRRIDHRRLIGNTYLCVETDENFHRYYNEDDEEARYHDVIMAHGGKLCFVRFNPHKFNLNDRYDHGPPLAKRLERLRAEVTRHIERLERGENTAYLEVHHLYYPEGTPDLYEEQCKPEWL